MFIKNQIYSYDEIKIQYKVANAGGIRYCSEQDTLILIHYINNGIYADKWKNEILYYTGEGQKGNQELKRGNKRLADTFNTDKTILLFEKIERNKYMFVSKVKLTSPPTIEKQNDITNHPRDVYIFPLKRID